MRLKTTLSLCVGALLGVLFTVNMYAYTSKKEAPSFENVVHVVTHAFDHGPHASQTFSMPNSFGDEAFAFSTNSVQKPQKAANASSSFEKNSLLDMALAVYGAKKLMHIAKRFVRPLRQYKKGIVALKVFAAASCYTNMTSLQQALHNALHFLDSKRFVHALGTHTQSFERALQSAFAKILPHVRA